MSSFKQFYLNENKNEEFFRKTTLDFVKETGHSDSITKDGNLIVYHGTSKKNADNILKTRKFKGHPWFALDKKTAEMYAKNHGGKNNVVIELILDPSAILPVGGNDYISARLEGLTLDRFKNVSNNKVWGYKEVRFKEWLNENKNEKKEYGIWSGWNVMTPSGLILATASGIKGTVGVVVYKNGNSYIVKHSDKTVNDFRPNFNRSYPPNEKYSDLEIKLKDK